MSLLESSCGWYAGRAAQLMLFQSYNKYADNVNLAVDRPGTSPCRDWLEMILLWSIFKTGLTQLQPARISVRKPAWLNPVKALRYGRLNFWSEAMLMTTKIWIATQIMLFVILGCPTNYPDLPQISVDFTWLMDRSCFAKIYDGEDSPQLAAGRLNRSSRVPFLHSSSSLKSI